MKKAWGFLAIAFMFMGCTSVEFTKPFCSDMGTIDIPVSAAGYYRGYFSIKNDDRLPQKDVIEIQLLPDANRSDWIVSTSMPNFVDSNQIGICRIHHDLILTITTDTGLYNAYRLYFSDGLTVVPFEFLESDLKKHSIPFAQPPSFYFNQAVHESGDEVISEVDIGNRTVIDNRKIDAQFLLSLSKSQSFGIFLQRMPTHSKKPLMRQHRFHSAKRLFIK